MRVPWNTSAPKSDQACVIRFGLVWFYGELRFKFSPLLYYRIIKKKKKKKKLFVSLQNLDSAHLSLRFRGPLALFMGHKQCIFRLMNRSHEQCIFRLMNRDLHCLCTWITLCRRHCVLFTHCLRYPQPLYSKKYIKNESQNTIYTFKNYFITVFSIFNKINYIQTNPIR